MLKKRVQPFAVLIAALLMTGCGKSYDFSQTELTEAIGVSRSVFDKMEIQPIDNGESGVELMEQAKAMTGSDFYTYWFEHSDSEGNIDMVAVNFTGGKVYSVELGVRGGCESEYSILGIHAGEKKDTAVAKAEEYFGEKGAALSDDKEMWGLTDMQYDSIYYGGASNKKGWLIINTETETDTVISIEYDKY